MSTIWQIYSELIGVYVRSNEEYFFVIMEIYIDDNSWNILLPTYLNIFFFHFYLSNSF